VHHKLASATADAENVAFPTDCSQYTGAARCLLSAVRGRKLLKSRGVHASHTRHHSPAQPMKMEFVNKSWISCTPLPGVLRLASPRDENLSATGRTLRVDELSLRVQTEEIDFKNVFLQPDVRLHSRSTVALHGRSYNNFVVLRAAVLETLCDSSQQTVD
jgi:hypothetical protein